MLLPVLRHVHKRYFKCSSLVKLNGICDHQKGLNFNTTFQLPFVLTVTNKMISVI